MKEIKDLKVLVALHLMPGIVTGLGYIFLLQMDLFKWFPKVFVFSTAVLLFLVPCELGIVLWLSYKETGSFRFMEIVGLKSRMKCLPLLGYAAGLFVLTGMLMMVFKPISDYLLLHTFGWIPRTYIFDQNMSGYRLAIVHGTIAIEWIALVILGPLVEEIYFRGVLLARMKWMGYKGVIVNTFLFAVYHVWSPWQVLSRAIGLLPLYATVYKKNALILAIVVHMLCNMTDVVALMGGR